MIEIKCVGSKQGGEAVYEMTDRGAVIGTAVTVRDGDTVTVCSCEAPDTALTDALFRAVLNAALSEGAVYALSASETVNAHAVRKGYSADFFHEPLNMKEFFSKFNCKG